MSAIQQNFLREQSRSFDERRSVTKSADVKTVFLCHSHEDQALVEGLLAIFDKYGIDLYIDWKDSSLPDRTNLETVKKIQEKIRTSDIFLMLATENSLASRWCPWELGFADARNSKIYILPTENNQVTYGNEYVDVYKSIIVADSGNLAIFDPHSSKGDKLSKEVLLGG